MIEIFLVGVLVGLALGYLFARPIERLLRTVEEVRRKVNGK